MEQTSQLTVRRRRFGIGIKLLMAFGSIVLLSALTAWVGWKGVRSIRSDQDRAFVESYPAVVDAYEVARECGLIDSRLSSLADSNSVDVLRIRQGELERSVEQLALFESPFRTSSSQLTIGVMRTTIQQIISLVEGRIEHAQALTESLEQVADRTRQVEETIDPLLVQVQLDMINLIDPSNGQVIGPQELLRYRALSGQAGTLSDILSLVLGVSSDLAQIKGLNDKASLSTLRAQVKARGHEVARSLLDIEDASQKQELARLLSTFVRADASQKGPFALKEEFDRCSQEIENYQADAETLANELVEETQKLVAESQDDIDRTSKQARETAVLVSRILIGLAVFSAVVSALLVYWFVFRQIVTRLDRSITAMGRLSDGDLTVQVDASGGDELADMGTAINIFRSNAETLRRQEANLRDQTNELAEKNEELDRLVYVASHDLRSPLRAINNLSQWVQEDCDDLLPDKSRKHLQVMAERVRLMDRLLDDVLRYTRISGGPAALEELRLLDLVRDAVSIVELRRGLVVHAHIEDVAVRISVSKVEMVLRNLIDNASKHHDLDQSRVDVHATWADGELRLVVADDGPGIPTDNPHEAFEIFRRFSVNSNESGSGIGLALVRKAVETSGGTIKLTTQDQGDRGTSIQILWPCDRVESSASPSRADSLPILTLQFGSEKAAQSKASS